MKTLRNGLILAILAGMAPAHASLADDGVASSDQYEIVPRGPAARGHFWLSDGPADVNSSNQSLGNRFQLGAEAQLGGNYQFILGATLLDLLSSGETSNTVGDISRTGWDFDFGYFFVPDKLWVEYSFQLGTVHGSDIGGHVGTTGHGIDLGYQFYDKDDFNLAIDASYLHIMSETISTFDFQTQTSGIATYPGANVWSLSLVAGFDVGGR